MNPNVFQAEREMLAQMAASDRQSRTAWMLHDRFATRPRRYETLRRVVGSILVTVGRRVQNLGWALHPGVAGGG